MNGDRASVRPTTPAVLWESSFVLGGNPVNLTRTYVRYFGMIVTQIFDALRRHRDTRDHDTERELQCRALDAVRRLRAGQAMAAAAERDLSAIAGITPAGHPPRL